MRLFTVKYLTLTVLCAALAVAVGCGGSSKPRPAGDPRERQLSLSVVAIEARVGGDTVRSSGSVIDARRGLVLTSAHSVWGATALKVMTGLGVLHGRVVARAPCDDLALLETQPRVPGLASVPAAGDAPGPSTLLTSVGRRASTADDAPASLLEIPVRALGGPAPTLPGLGLKALAGAVRLDSDLVPEATGGPILDGRGRPIGMAVAAGLPSQRTAAVALPWSAVQERLRELQPGPQRLFVGWRDQYACVARMHAFTSAAHPGFNPLDAKLVKPISVSRLPGTEELDR